jgi:hypothetical protein
MPADVRRGRRTLLLLALVCLLPVAASYLAFYVWQPQGRVNHGRLVGPLALPAGTLAGAGGQPALTRSEFEGRWTLLVVASAGCDAACTRALYVSRQARLAQAKEMERVGRVWLLSDAGEAAPAALDGQAGLRLARADAAWLGALRAAAGTEGEKVGGRAGGRLFLVDPLGNLMMDYADEADTTSMARGVTRDLQRLLKYSGLGRG